VQKEVNELGKVDAEEELPRNEGSDKDQEIGEDEGRDGTRTVTKSDTTGVKLDSRNARSKRSGEREKSLT
jgi:hypothetical protein